MIWRYGLVALGIAAFGLTSFSSAATAEKVSLQATQATNVVRDYWAFKPLSRIPPPPVRNAAWCRTPIDRFILARLERRGLQPNPPADRRVLARRAYLDLTGLPPNPSELDTFLSDASSDGYEKLLDRLLDSPAYGERWARFWLDTARFAESHGFEQDYDRPFAYYYRDFVIKALSQNIPYDQFVRWQLAGDELAPENPLAMMATGFLGAGVFPTQLTEKEFESSRYDELDDMAGTMGTTMLGLTIGCARCHDHKFDPISTREYYRLVSTFTTAIRSEVDLDLEPERYRGALAEWHKKEKLLDDALRQYERAYVDERFKAWLAHPELAAVPKSPWQFLEPTEVKSTQGTHFEILSDFSVLARGGAPDKDEYTFAFETRLHSIGALRVEALADDSLPKKGPGRASNGNFALTDLSVFVQPLGKPDSEPLNVKVVSARATHEQDHDKLSVAAAIDSNPDQTGWAVDKGGIGKDQAAVFVFDKPIEFAEGTRLTVRLRFRLNSQHSIGRVRISIAGDPSALIVGEGISQFVADGIAVLQGGQPDQLTAKQRLALKKHFANTDPEWKRHHEAMLEHHLAKPKPNLAKVMVTSEGFQHMKHNADDRGFPHFYPQTYFLQRGDVNQKRDVVSQGFLQVLMRGGKAESNWQRPPPSDWTRTSYRRAALANWITDVDYGAGTLLARVMVNRIWHGHFGRGIVASPNDFGVQGERPTHPELLDWLADDLIQHRWNLKRLHKLIMSSAVYQQAAAYDPDKAKLDVENLLLWRFTPRRLEAEAVRDSILAVSGLLDRRMFGPGTLDPNMHRRSIYFFVKRSQLIPMMVLFDCPEPLASMGRRSTTTIAPQALLLMNDSLIRNCAEGLARRVRTSALASASETIREAYLVAFARAAKSDEMRMAEDFLRQQTQRYKETHSENAEALALTDYCQALLASNEFLYIQ